MIPPPPPDKIPMIPPPPARAAAASPLPGFPSSPLGPSPSPHLAASSVDPAANLRQAPGRLPELLRPDDLQPRAAGAAPSSSPPPLPAPTASSRLVRVAASHPSSWWRTLRRRWVSRPFYRWLAEKYPMVLVDVVEEESVEIEGVKVPVDTSKPKPNILEYDNLYLDMNRTIHPASTPRTGRRRVVEKPVQSNRGPWRRDRFRGEKEVAGVAACPC